MYWIVDSLTVTAFSEGIQDNLGNIARGLSNPIIRHAKFYSGAASSNLFYSISIPWTDPSMTPTHKDRALKENKSITFPVIWERGQVLIECNIFPISASTNGQRQAKELTIGVDDPDKQILLPSLYPSGK